jgi:uncharacterized flavoprotein (TIGR03862 family)
MGRKHIIIVGGGPAGLMAADVLSAAHNVSLFDKENNVGQKFLVAGKGGFNLTSKLQGEELTGKYSPAGFMNKALSEFDPSDLRQWFSSMGIPTFAGSGGRVFPEKGIRPVDILDKIKTKLLNQGVQFHMQHELTGFDNNRHITFKNQEQETTFEADYIVFAMGGASWPKTGSDGSWRTVFESMGIKTNPFQPSNCGINIKWPDAVRLFHSGKPLKNIQLSVNDIKVPGEAVITDNGMEGSAVYQLVPAIRNLLNKNLPVTVYVDFKPSNTEEQLLRKTEGKNVRTKDYGRLFNLSPAQMAVIKSYTTKESFLSLPGFVSSIKQVAIHVDSMRPVEEAISTIGGIDPGEVNDDFALKKYPWIYVVGEMLDWDAPTGGFLIQGCVSMGNYAAKSIMSKE